MNADFWYGAMVGVPILIFAAPFAIKGYRTGRDERALIRGRKGAPGIPEVPPLGVRLSNVERGVDASTKELAEVRLVVDGHTAALKTVQEDITVIKSEFSENGGNSMRDQVNKLVELSKKPRRTRVHIETEPQ